MTRLPLLTAGVLLAALACAGCLAGPPVPENDPYVETPVEPDEVIINVHVLGDGDPARPISEATVRLWNDSQAIANATSDDAGATTFRLTRPETETALRITAVADGWTEELNDDATIGPDRDDELELVVPLYRTELVATDRFEWESPGDVNPLSSRSWKENGLTFFDNPELQRAYASRIDTLSVRLEWNNTLTTYGDFGVFIEGNSGGRADSDKPQDLGTEGRMSEEVAVGRSQLLHMVDSHEPLVRYGAETEESVIAPDGLRIDVTITATFRTPPIEAAVPPAAFVLWLAALAAIFALARRRR